MFAKADQILLIIIADNRVVCLKFQEINSLAMLLRGNVYGKFIVFFAGCLDITYRCIRVECCAITTPFGTTTKKPVTAYDDVGVVRDDRRKCLWCNTLRLRQELLGFVGLKSLLQIFIGEVTSERCAIAHPTR